jgi:hypothetical protein
MRRAGMEIRAFARFGHGRFPPPNALRRKNELRGRAADARKS